VILVRPTIYLAGQIRKSADPVSWRVDIRQSSSEFEWIDPVRREVDFADEEAIVEGDLELIDNSDGLLVGWHDDVPSVGTPMEIIHAARSDIPVVIWRRDDGDNPLSPWMRYHADVVRGQRDAALWQLHGLAGAEVKA
jgi:nucleoside 2-deoxyribosyltransferase